MWRTIISWRKQSQHPTATCSLHEMWDVRRDNLGIWLWNYRWTRLIIHPPEALFSQHQNLPDAIFFFHLQTIFILHTTEKKETPLMLSSIGLANNRRLLIFYSETFFPLTSAPHSSRKYRQSVSGERSLPGGRREKKKLLASPAPVTTISSAWMFW